MKKLFIGFVFFLFYLTSFSQENSTFKDPRDGKEYKTVKIGTQTWLAENFAFKPDTGVYWKYKSKSARYEYYYDWETANKIAPPGWHLPSEQEWDLLVAYLGKDSIIIKLLIHGSSGFNALRVGYRMSSSEDSYYGVGSHACFWSSTPNDKTVLKSTYKTINLAVNFEIVTTEYNKNEHNNWANTDCCTPRGSGLNVRLIKDK